MAKSRDARRSVLRQGEAMNTASPRSRVALRFILLIGVLSFFADFTYEGSRSIVGPYLASLQASGTIVGTVSGLGELLGYGLRLFSGRIADTTGRYWPITIFGYVVQMASVPALALASSWPSAAALIILERIGKAIRNPPRDVMLSHAGKQAGGYGWAFGLHEAIDQFGAMFGPLAVAAILAHHGSYREGFAVLLVPAAINLSLVMTARWLYPKPEDMEVRPPTISGARLPRIFWIYLFGAALVAAGFADYSLIAYHFSRRDGPDQLDRDLLCGCDGRERHGISGAWEVIRPLRFYGSRSADANIRAVCTSGLSRRFLARAPRRRDLGTWYGRPRIHHSGGGHADGLVPPARLGIRCLYRGVRHLLVHWQRRDRDAL